MVDNGSGDARRRGLRRARRGSRSSRLERNAGYTRASTSARRRADGELIVLLNDDCVCDPGFVERITAPIDPAAGVVMAAGVMRDWRDRSLIDSAGMELDRTLLVFDYLNGEPLSRLDGGVADPIGPSAAAAAFDRATFLVGRRLRRAAVRLLGGRRPGPAPAPARACAARSPPTRCGDHEHSATLGSGSARKNYLMGYGRGYVLRKWGVLNAAAAAARCSPARRSLCAGQAVLDRNLAGIRGRVRGYRAAAELERYPDGLGLERGAGARSRPCAAARARRTRLRAAPRADRRAAHRSPSSTSPTPAGPSRSLEARARLARRARARSTSSSPGPGNVGEVLGDAGGGDPARLRGADQARAGRARPDPRAPPAVRATSAASGA